MERLFRKASACLVIPCAGTANGFEHPGGDEVAQVSLGLLKAQPLGVFVARSTDSPGHRNIMQGGYDSFLSAGALREVG